VTGRHFNYGGNRMSRFKKFLVVGAVFAVAAAVTPVLALQLPSIPIVNPPTAAPDTTVPSVPSVPTSIPAPPTIDTTTLANVLKAQVQALADALGEAPTDVLNLVLNTYIPTPSGAVADLTSTIQEYIDRLANNALIGGRNTGIVGTPEVAIGDIVASFGFARVYGGVTGTVPGQIPPRPYPTQAEALAAMPQYRTYTSPYLPATPAVPPSAALLAFLLLGSELPVVTGQIPPGTVPQALTPVVPLLGPFNHFGGPLVTIEGRGWDERGADPSRNIKSQSGTSVVGAKHTGGNGALSGTNLDTAPRTTSTDPLDPWPVYVPLFTSNANLGAGTNTTNTTEHSIQFLGWKGAVSDALHCGLGTTGNADTDPVPVVNGNGTYTWPDMKCSSVGALSGDGVALFNNELIDFHTDLAPLWSPAPPSVTDANAAIAAIIAALPTGTLTTYGLTVALTYLPTVLGVVGTLPPLPEVPAVPAVP
jgi:hypothetical protein